MEARLFVQAVGGPSLLTDSWSRVTLAGSSGSGQRLGHVQSNHFPPVQLDLKRMDGSSLPATDECKGCSALLHKSSKLMMANQDELFMTV